MLISTTNLSAGDELTMNAKEYTDGKDFSGSSGLPEGKTIIDLEIADFGETEFEQEDGSKRPANQVTIKNDKGEDVTYNLPKSVMQKVQEAVEKNAKGLEVNRSGLTCNGTSYVTYLLDDAGKVIQE